MEAREWLELLEEVNNEVRQLTSQLRQQGASSRDPKNRRTASRKVASVHDDVRRLEKSLADMEARPLKYKIGEGELNRRRGMLSRVKASTKTLDELLSGKSRASLLRGHRKKKNYEETDATRDLSNRGLYDQQQQQVRNQDDQLDDILSGVTKLKVMGNEINSELDLHESLLDDIDDHMDGTDARLQANIARVDDVEEKSASCMPLLIIVLLLILIVVLIFV